MERLNVNHDRIARLAILNGINIPPQTAAVLEARGVNLGDLTTRIRGSMEFKR
jgi:hypothetical protein